MSSIQIDYDINPWLKSIDLQKNKEYLNKLLNLGKQVSDMAEISVNPNSNFLEPINQKVFNLSRECQLTYDQMVNLSSVSNNNINTIQDRITSLNTDIKSALSQQYTNVQSQCTQLAGAITKLTGNVNNSSLKGKIGENFLENILKTSFADDIVNVMAQTGHEADIHLESKKYPKILIESKLYKNCVTGKELTKFYSDLDRTGINYGIFISLTSNITKHRRLEYEKLNDKHIIYLPNAGFDGVNVIYAIIFLRELDNLLSKNVGVSKEDIEEKCRVIYESIKTLDSIFELLSRMRNDTIRTKNNIDKSMSELVTNVLKIEMATKDLISKLKTTVTTSLADLNKKYKVFSNPDLDNLIQTLSDSNNKLDNKLSSIITLLKSSTSNFCEDEKSKDRKFILLNQGEKYCEIKCGKTKATCTFAKNNLKMDVKASTDLANFKMIVDCLNN